MAPVQNVRREYAPAAPKKKSRQALSVTTAMHYEEVLTDLECAMRECNADEVRALVPQLIALSEELKVQPGLAALLERGRFGHAARERLRKEYISRYVLLRGGAQDESAPLMGANPDQSSVMGGMGGDGDDGYLSKLTDVSIRHGFIQKVYGILSIQLLVTTLIGGATMYVLPGVPPPFGLLCFILSLVVMIGAMCTCYCRPALMRSFPDNYILLSVFTVAESVLVGCLGAQYTAGSVLIVAGVTAFVVFGLSLFACQTSYDFSGWGPYLFCALLVMTGLSFSFLIGALLGLASSSAFQGLHFVFSCLGVMLFSFYIVYDTQLIVGGKQGGDGKMFAVDDYCMAALTLYMDIIQLFLHLLALFGDRR